MKSPKYLVVDLDNSLLKLGCSLAIARKPGKLPYETVRAEYSLECGVDALELHTDAA